MSLKRPVGDGLPAAWGAAGYSMFGAEIFNSDIRYDGDEVHIEVGGLTERRTSPWELRFDPNP